MDSTLDVEPRGSGLLGKCVLCSLSLPLRLPANNEEGGDWRCAGCGSIFYGLLLAGGLATELRRNVEFVATESSSSDNLAAAGFKPNGTAQTVLSARTKTLCPVHTPLSRALDTAIDRGVALRIGPQGVPFADRTRKAAATTYEKQNISRFVQSVEESFDRIEELYADLKLGHLPRLEAAESISEMALVSAAEDMDLFVSLAINPPNHSYPSRHGLHVAMLAMSIGSKAGWDEHTLIDLGIGCLIHDVGMLELKDDLIQERRVLTAREHSEVVKHPLRTFDMVERRLDQVPPRSRMVAYQMHERCNGEGYPRGRSSRQIHPLAKVAAVADVFTALVSPRPHRPGMMPYYALKHLLYSVRGGLFDADAVRALLSTVSLFPLGSRVSLSDGQVGTVIRANGELFDRPVVELVTQLNEAPQPAILDLSRQANVRVEKPLAA